MPTPRKALISLADTSYYHCISRCVRHCFLCGEDKTTNKNYEHRRQLLEDKLLQVTQVFAIDLCAYAIMTNHFHVVLHVDKSTADTWTTEQILTQWHKLYKGTLLTQRYMNDAKRHELTTAEIETVISTADVYRQRLYDISWYMKSINEYVARQANKEDECTGHFWEGRFKSQALLDETALLTCMAYVDLNPVRAKIAATPETSKHTSIKQRVDFIGNADIAGNNLDGAKAQSKTNITAQPSILMPFIDNDEENMTKGIPFNFLDYFELVNETGKVVKQDKRGFIIDNTPILQRIGINATHWLTLCTEFEKHFKGAASNENTLIKQYKTHVKSNCDNLAVNTS